VRQTLHELEDERLAGPARRRLHQSLYFADHRALSLRTASGAGTRQAGRRRTARAGRETQPHPGKIRHRGVSIPQELRISDGQTFANKTAERQSAPLQVEQERKG